MVEGPEWRTHWRGPIPPASVITVMLADLLRFAGGAVSLIGLGLVMGFSPTLIAVALRILTQVQRPDRLIAGMLVGLALGSTALLLVLQFIDPRTLEAALRNQVEGVLVRRSVDLVFGTLFVLAAVVMGVRLRRPRRQGRARLPRSAGMQRPWQMIVVGASNTVIGVSGLATVYVAARLVRGISTDDPIRVLAYAVFLVATVSPYVLLTWAWRRLPRAARRITTVFHRLATMDRRPWEFGIVLVIGLILLGLGVWGSPRPT